jgi:hypothetical protein
MCERMRWFARDQAGSSALGVEVLCWLEDRLIAFELFELGGEGVDLAGTCAQADEDSAIWTGRRRVNPGMRAGFKLHVETRQTGSQGDGLCPWLGGLPPLEGMQAASHSGYLEFYTNRARHPFATHQGALTIRRQGAGSH